MHESRIYRTGPHWHGFLEVTHLIVFGDSYSDIGYNHATEKPDSKNPLGTKFSGSTWNEQGEPNWVGHLITKHCPHPRFDSTREEQLEEYCNHALLVYDYAKRGDTVDGVRHQVQDYFLLRVGQKPEWASWNADNSLFVTWIGLNDCTDLCDLSLSIKRLFELQEQLYEAGARNFLFVDVPPIHRSPAVFKFPEMSDTSTDDWNALLKSAIKDFTAAHNDVTTLLFSSARTFHNLLDNPILYGFDTEDVKKSGGPIWMMDHIHPTSRVHDFVAEDLARFLNTVQLN